jgi:hypothetical protein
VPRHTHSEKGCALRTWSLATRAKSAEQDWARPRDLSADLSVGALCVETRARPATQAVRTGSGTPRVCSSAAASRACSTLLSTAPLHPITIATAEGSAYLREAAVEAGEPGAHAALELDNQRVDLALEVLERRQLLEALQQPTRRVECTARRAVLAWTRGPGGQSSSPHARLYGESLSGPEVTVHTDSTALVYARRRRWTCAAGSGGR